MAAQLVENVTGMDYDVIYTAEVNLSFVLKLLKIPKYNYLSF